MPRKRSDFSAAAEKRLIALMAAGGTAATISKALLAAGVKGASSATVGRRMRELRGDVAPKRVLAPRGARADRRAEYATPDDSIVGDSPLPSTPEEIPEGTALSQIERWLKRAESMGKIAVEKGDLAGMGQMGRLTSALLEAKRKDTPIEKEDPTESPDMQKLALQVEVRLLKYVDDIVGGSP